MKKITIANIEDVEWAVGRPTVNQNFTTIAERAGLTFIEAYNSPITINPADWKDARLKKPYRDVHNVSSDEETVAEVCGDVIAGRAVVDVIIPDPNDVYVTYTDIAFLPHVVDKDAGNVTMRLMIAQCGIDLVDHTKFTNEELGDAGVQGRKKMRVSLQAVISRPNQPVTFRVLLL